MKPNEMPLKRAATASSFVAQIALLTCATGLALTGCQTTTQLAARKQAADRWGAARAQVKLKLAADQLAVGHFEDAAAELTEAARLDPDNQALVPLQARVLLAQGQDAAAQKLLESAALPDDQQAETQYLLGVIWQQRLRWNSALECFVRAADLAPDEITYLVAATQVLLQLGRARESLELLESREERFGWTKAYHAAMAESLEQRREWLAAAAAWRRVNNGGRDAQIRERLGAALAAGGRWGEAAAVYEQLLEGADASTAKRVRLSLVECLLQDRQPEAARGQAQTALHDDPRDLAALLLLTRCLAMENNAGEALAAAEQALRVSPESRAALEAAAVLSWRCGHASRAVGYAHRLLALFGEPNEVASAVLSKVRGRK